MAKFIYEFEQILNVKQKLEKQEEMKLGKAMQALSGALNQLEVISLKYNDSMSTFQTFLKGGNIEPKRVKSLNESVAYYHQQVMEAKRIVASQEKAVEEAKERLQDALRERRTYEILKEKAYEVYLEEEKVAEAKQIDEIVSFKYKDE